MNQQQSLNLEADRLPPKREQRRSYVKTMKERHGIFTDLCKGGGDWMAFSVPECAKGIGDRFGLTEDRVKKLKLEPIEMLAEFSRLLDEAGLIEEDHNTEYEAVRAVASRIEADAEHEKL